ncbi:MAG TPA: hypothetical protein VFH45_03315 [Acidimicrobiales bacterium]|nr:hypothetical protein [Acidimicrobiales bacterium]
MSPYRYWMYWPVAVRLPAVVVVVGAWVVGGDVVAVGWDEPDVEPEPAEVVGVAAEECEPDEVPAAGDDVAAGAGDEVGGRAAVVEGEAPDPAGAVPAVAGAPVVGPEAEGMAPLVAVDELPVDGPGPAPLDDVNGPLAAAREPIGFVWKLSTAARPATEAVTTIGALLI